VYPPKRNLYGLFFLLFILAVLTNNCKEEPTAKPEHTVIKGKINNHSGGSIIKIETHDFSNSRNFYTRTENNEYYTIRFKQYHPHRVSLYYNNSSINVYTKPGDITEVNFNASSFPESNIIFRGDSKEINQLMNAFEHVWKSIEESQYDKQAKKYSFSDYKKFVDKETDKLLNRLEKFKENNKMCCGFEQWARTEIKYHKYYRLMRYSWLNPLLNNRSPSMHKPVSYNEKFLNDVKIEDPGALHSKFYNDFLSEYTHRFHLQMLRNRDSSKSPVSYSDRIKHIISSSDKGFVRYYMLTDLYGEILDYVPMDTLESITYSLLSKIHYGPMREYINDQYWKTKYFDDAGSSILKEVPGMSITNLLDSIHETGSKKMIYIDVWADWCGSCIKNIPQLKNMQKHLSNKPIQFVTFAIESKAYKVREILLKEELKSNNFLLNESQTNELQKKFNFSYIPRYILIGKNGNVIDENAPHPGKEAIQAIEKHLNQ